MQDQEEKKREKLVNELRALDGWAADAAGEKEACGWLCGAAGNGSMTLADISYFPFLERIDATMKYFKVSEPNLKLARRKAVRSRSEVVHSVVGLMPPSHNVKHVKQNASVRNAKTNGMGIHLFKLVSRGLHTGII